MNTKMFYTVFVCAMQFCFSASTMGRQIFILAGQSNMAGRGGVSQVNHMPRWDGVIPPECQSTPQILRLNDHLLWEEAKEPLHGGISVANCSTSRFASGIGPGMPFARSLLQRDPLFGVIGLVPCAVGGTRIAEWSRGSCLYNRLLERVRAAVLEGGVLRGMLWYQGESDTDIPEDAMMYGKRLETFFTDFRSDLLCPSLPILQVALASGNASRMGIVRDAQLKTSLPQVKCVDAAGLQLNGDNLHLTTNSQLRLGSMMAEAFLRFFWS